MKAKIVKEDEYEQGKRVLLNLGHTFGHAFEKSVNTNGEGQSILHGEAIGIGICLAAKLSEDFEESNIEDSIAIEKLVADFGLPTNILDISKNLKISEVIKFMKHDKKRSDDKNTLILLKGIGEAFIHNDVKDKDLARFLNNQGLKK
jgi:3-dehydroquinate synthase